MKNLTYCLILFFTADLLWSQQATLHPTTFTSQGVLRDAQGRSLEDDTYEMIFSNEQNQNLPAGRIHPLVSLLVRDSSEWPSIDITILESGDKEVASLLFARYYTECLLTD